MYKREKPKIDFSIVNALRATYFSHNLR